MAVKFFSFKKRYLVVVISSLLIFNFFIFNHDKALEKITSLNTNENRLLTKFFKYVFFYEGWGFVIFYDKPLSYMSINISQKLEPPKNSTAPSNLVFTLRESWGVWDKYAHGFMSKNFGMVKEWGSETLKVYFVNKTNFKKIVNRHLIDFHTVLQSKLSADKILEEFLSGTGEIYQKIISHDGLFGTLLGYGRNNSWAYMKADQREGMDSLDYDMPEGSQEIPGVCCRVLVETEETNNLRIRYEKQRQELSNLYQREDFLEKVLMGIVSEKIK